MRIKLGCLCLSWVLLGLFGLGAQLHTNSANKVRSSLYILLQPGQTYTIRFDKPVPVSQENDERPPFLEWVPGYVKILQIQPRAIRFRTMTLKEAIAEAKRQNEESRKYGDEEIDLEFVRREYSDGSPFMLRYVSWSPQQNRSDTIIDITFSIETSKRRAQAQRIKVGKQGLEIKPALNKAGVRCFLIPEGKDKTIYVLPSDRFTALSKDAVLGTSLSDPAKDEVSAEPQRRARTSMDLTK